MEDASIWTGAVAANRWVLYATMLLAAGSAIFLTNVYVAMPIAARVAKLAQAAAVVCMVCYVLSIGFGGAEMIAGDAGALFSKEAWAVAVGTTLGKSAFFGLPGLMGLYLALRSKNVQLGPYGRKSTLIITAVFALGSFTMTGHAATAPPLWLAGTAVMMHLVCAAFWMGAFYPLYLTARELPAHEAGGVMTRFSNKAVAYVGALVISGMVIGGIQLQSVSALFGTEYGQKLVVKVLLFAALAAIAAYNKFVLTPQLERGDDTAARRIRRSVMTEYGLYIVIILMAASLTMSVPPRAL